MEATAYRSTIVKSPMADAIRSAILLDQPLQIALVMRVTAFISATKHVTQSIIVLRTMADVGQTRRVHI